MDILNSNWLIKMLEKSSPTPHGRLLSLFDILEDWLSAPNIAEQVRSGAAMQASSHQLQDYLTIEAAKAGAAMPEMLANQLYFMAIAAVLDRLHANAPEHPLSNSLHEFDSPCNRASLSHAKNVARALISAQTKKEFRIAKPATYAIAASFIALFVIAGSLLLLNLNTQPIRIALLPQPIPRLVTPTTASPEQTAALMAQLEQMRHGNCQLIEAIQLPDKVKGIYLNMIVNGQVSTDPYEQNIAMELLKKTRCNYTPMLMVNSTG